MKELTNLPTRVRPDAKGRITLGKWAQDISSFLVHPGEDGKIILEPYSEIPAKEIWLFENKDALASVKRGLKDSTAGRVRSRGSFKKFLKSKS